MTTEFLGYKVEQVSSESGKINYLLHGPKVTYRLIRRANGNSLYVINSKGNICNIKGNYDFVDSNGSLHCAMVL